MQFFENRQRFSVTLVLHIAADSFLDRLQGQISLGVNSRVEKAIEHLCTAQPELEMLLLNLRMSAE
jgi:hypothetical protein